MLKRGQRRTTMTSSANTSAEERFRQAFARLKEGRPNTLSAGALVSQNNVAKESGCDPSALRKSRYPELINEIQAYIDAHKDERPTSNRQEILKKRRKNRSIRQSKIDSDRQRDQLASQLLCANAQIVELSRKLADANTKLESLMPSAQLLSLSSRRSKVNPTDI